MADLVPVVIEKSDSTEALFKESFQRDTSRNITAISVTKFKASATQQKQQTTNTLEEPQSLTNVINISDEEQSENMIDSFIIET